MGTEDRYDSTSIATLEGAEAVRRRPGMYVGNVTDGSGVAGLLWEALDLALDPVAGGRGDRIEVTLFSDGSVAVEDSGPGLGVEAGERGIPEAEALLTTLCPRGRLAAGDPYKISAGTHGVGVVVTCALSEWLALEVHRGGRVWRQRYRHGKPQGPLEAGEPSARTGTRLHFLPDASIFTGALRLTPEQVLRELRDRAALHPGVTIELRSPLVAPRGMASLVEDATVGRATLLDEPLRFAFEGPAEGGGVMRGEVAIQWLARLADADEVARVHAFACGSRNSEGGAHVAGVRAGLLQGACDLLVRRGKVSKARWRRMAADIGRRTVLAVSVDHPGVLYRSRTKACVANPDIRRLLRRVTRARVVSLLTAWPELLVALHG